MALRPGLYKLVVETIQNGLTSVQEQDFGWGVLAVNTHKSIYLPNEEAFIGIAVLDNEGRMVCDADVTLVITDPNNATPTINEGLQYGLYAAAISSLTKDMAERSGQSPHSTTSSTSIHLAQIGCNDIRADGILDGQGFTNDETQTVSTIVGTRGSCTVLPTAGIRCTP